MNISVRHTVFLAVLLGLANSVWAICEAEYAVYRDAYQMMGYNAASAEGHARAQQESDILSAQRLSAEDRQKQIAEIQAMLKRAGIGKTASDRLSIAAAAKYLCVLDATRSANYSNQNTNTQQSQSTQQQSQQAQQQAQQTQQLAAQNQARADQGRQGKRRRHEPENEASQCIQPDFGGLYGGMKNTCDFKVWYTYCGYRPKENSWLTGMDCEKQSFGSWSVSPGRTSASHTKGVESIHWIACKEPAWALDAEFVPGQGIKGRCYTVGGN